MPDGNDHLSLEQILETWRSETVSQEDAKREIQEHLSHCQECREVAAQYRDVMSNLDQYSRAVDSTGGVNCRPEETWIQLAAGLLPEEENIAALEHAAECRACSLRLRQSMEVVGSNAGPAPELARHLKSSDFLWQGALARKMAALTAPREPSRLSRFWSRLTPPRLVWATAGVIAVLVIAFVDYQRFSQTLPEELLARAYSRQRTIELRINGASYGPMRVQREHGSSQLNAPSQLLEAETLIKKRMEKKPEAPDSLREKAEVDLLNWDYQPAIETLGRALRLQPRAFLILLDLGTAHFERAEATNSPADYEASLNYLGDAIRLEPANPTALFNRAIVYERLYLYGRAIEDWEQFLKVEKDPGWRKEAEQRLQELRSREQQQSQRQSPETLSVSEFTANLKQKHFTSIEEYLEVAERQILPNITAVDAGDPNFSAAGALADELEVVHRDEFLRDLLHDAGKPSFMPATMLLGKSSTANREGRSDEAYAKATQAAALFRQSGNVAGEVAASFEQTYALQFQSKAARCQALAQDLVNKASRQNYVGLHIQLLLEEAICSNVNRQIGPAKVLARKALELAKNHGYKSLYLRGLTMLASLEAEAGNDAVAWSAIHEGLGIYWDTGLPAVRAYSLYALLDRMTEQLGHPNVQFAAALEALHCRPKNSSRTVEGIERARLGAAALSLGDVERAEAEFHEADKIFSSLPQTDFVRWRKLETGLWLAQIQALRGIDTSQTQAKLLTWMPKLEESSDRFLEFQYYDILADLKIRSGDSAGAKLLLLKAIEVAQDGIRSLSTWRERLAWSGRYRRPYASLAETLVNSGDPGSALEVWEHFRLADTTSFSKWIGLHSQTVSRPFSSTELQQHSQTSIITFAMVPDGMIVWARNASALHSVYLSVPPESLKRAAKNLLAECSRPDSDMAALRADAQYLYKWLVQPVSPWLPATGHIIIEPDGILGITPFDVLMDADGSYLGSRYTITMASSIKASEQQHGSSKIEISDHALVAAAPASPDGLSKPAPGVYRESLDVAQRFKNPVVLDGNEVQVGRIGRELLHSNLFHFAGHASMSQSGAAMLMADGILGANRARLFEGQKLRNLKLAVFSACDTAGTSEVSDSDSLVTTFLHAGAQNVVASRWNVDSIATVEFIDLFYRSILSGDSIAESLQKAAADFRKLPERSHPYYWAAFAAFGHS